MATVTLTSRFQQLGRAPDNLLRSYSDTEVTSRTSTQFIYRHEDDSPFEGLRVIVSGSGFTYRNGDPTAGTISSITIQNQNGQTVASLTGLVGKSLAQFYDRADSSGSSAWSYLLSGNDVINGTGASDGRWLPGSKAGNDTYNGGGGQDSFVWEAGREQYNGGSGYDLLSYRQMPEIAGTGEFTGVVIDATARTAIDRRGIIDRFTSIEAFEGSRYRDRYVGVDTAWDRFAGLRGADRIDGGADSFDSAGQRTGDNFDMVLHWQDFWSGARRGIVANLYVEDLSSGTSIVGTVTDGFGSVDRVIDIEGVGGTRYADVFRGSSSDNWFVGGEGRDSYVGGDGRDRVMFDEWFGTRTPAGVSVDLGRATGQIINDGFGNTETALGIENITSGRAADRLTGSGEDNELRGQGGNDVLSGREGNDRLFAGSGNDSLFAGLGADTLNGGMGKDNLYGGTDAIGDVFVFSNRLDSRFGRDRDVIHNFTLGTDDIDLRGIDARVATSTNDIFVFSGKTAAAHSVWWRDSAGNAVSVHADITGDGRADIEVLVNGTSSLTADNFLL